MVSAAIAVGALAVTLALFVWVGVARGRGGDLEDYVVARRSQGAGTLGLSFLASGVGAWVLFAAPEVGAFVGVAGVVGYAVAAAGPIVLLGVFGARLRRVLPAGHTLTEFARLRYGRVFGGYVVVASVLYMFFFLAAELTAVGAVTDLLSELDPRVAVVAVSVATVAYTAYGGLRASLRTDRWQGWLLIVLLTVGVGALLFVVPDPGAAMAQSQQLSVDRVGVEAGVALVLAVTAANLFHQGYWQRVWAARDTAALARGAGLGAALSVPVVLVAGLAGIVAAGWAPDLGDPPVPFFALLTELPAWMLAAVLVLGVSLVASSVDTLQNGLAGLVAVERPGLSLAAVRGVTVAVLVPAAAVAFQGYSVLRLLLIADLLCATVVAPALLGLWGRATRAGALAGGVAGLLGAVAPGLVATASLSDAVVLATFPEGVPTLPPFAGALLASTLVTVFVSVAGRERTDLSALDAHVPSLSDTHSRPDGQPG